MTRVLRYSVVVLYFAFLLTTYSESQIQTEDATSPGEVALHKVLLTSKCENQLKSLSQMLDCVKSKFRVIYPGTLWCGPGNRSSNPDQLGFFRKADRCCRDHDMCNMFINAGETKYGLTNQGFFVRSHCSCETEFHTCLSKARTLTSMKMGFTYFNILRPKCFDYTYPATCQNYDVLRLRGKKCVRYYFDKSKDKIWQWFDSPDFISLLNLFGRQYFSFYTSYL